jgi:hypothetical protein
LCSKNFGLGSIPNIKKKKEKKKRRKKFKTNFRTKRAGVAHVSNFSYTRGRDRRTGV